VIRVGISGWRYEPWRGVFYPEDLAQRRELEFASRRFPTVEINGSFYSLQRPEYYEEWRAQTPRGFVFGVKGSRYITHLLRLKEIDRPIANFFASGVLALEEKLGPFLWQFPPTFPFQPERLESFFEKLPRTAAAALALARRRDARMKGRSRLKIGADRPLRHAIEIRHKSFADPSFLPLLRKHRIGLVVADTAGKWPKMLDVTSDFVYVRLHGDAELYRSGYSARALAQWARLVRGWDASGKDVYVYFDNDAKVKAPFDALCLMRKLGLRWEARLDSAHDGQGPVLHRRRRARRHDAGAAARPRRRPRRGARKASRLPARLPR
jgi:uncharacterized protein YecE (DUF72 family)